MWKTVVFGQTACKIQGQPQCLRKKLATTLARAKLAKAKLAEANLPTTTKLAKHCLGFSRRCP